MNTQVELRVEEIKKHGYSIDFGEIINDGFNILKNVAGYAALGMLIWVLGNWIISAIVNTITGMDTTLESWLETMRGETNPNILKEQLLEITSSSAYLFSQIIIKFTGVLLFPIFAGILNLAYIYDKGEAISFNDLFIGYQGKHFGKLALLYLICKILVYMGAILFLLPGIYLWAALALGTPFILYGHASAIDAIKSSITVVNKNWFVFFGSMLLTVIIGYLGLLLCCVGMLITYPLFLINFYVLYKYSVGFAEKDLMIEEIGKE